MGWSRRAAVRCFAFFHRLARYNRAGCQAVTPRRFPVRRLSSRSAFRIHLQLFALLLPAAATKEAEQGIPCIAVPSAQDIPRFSHAEKALNRRRVGYAATFRPRRKAHSPSPMKIRPFPHPTQKTRCALVVRSPRRKVPCQPAKRLPPCSRRNGIAAPPPLPRPCAGKTSSRIFPFPAQKKSRLPATLSPPRRAESPAPRVNLSDSSFVLLLRLLGLRKPLRQPRPELIAPDDGVGAHARAAPVAALRAHARKVQALGLDHVRSAFWTAASHFLNRFLLSFFVLSIPQRASDGKS